MEVKFQGGRHPQNQHILTMQDSKVLVLAPCTWKPLRPYWTRLHILEVGKGGGPT